MNLKRIAFVFYCFAVCGLFYYLFALNAVMIMALTEGATSVVRWAAVITLSAFILFFLWRRSKSAYKSLWLIEKQKEKPKLDKIKRLESPQAEEEEEEAYLDDRQYISDSKP